MERPVKLVLLALVLFAAQPALGQAGYDQAYIGLDIGPSQPFGSFADASPGSATGGRALPGYNSTLLNFGWRIGEHFGVALAGSYGEYVWRDGGDDDWWQMASLTVGPMYTQRLSSRAALDLKAMAGWMSLRPVIDGLSDPNDQGNALGVDLRAAVRYQMFSKWGVFAEAGVQGANITLGTGARQDYRAVISGFGVTYRLW
jgi:hypothetical protein